MVAVSPAVPKTAARAAAEEALLDAAERLLADAGYAGVTTRRLAARMARVNAEWRAVLAEAFSGSSSSGWAASTPGTASYWIGSTNGCPDN